jgi:hypothetical protein
VKLGGYNGLEWQLRWEETNAYRILEGKHFEKWPHRRLRVKLEDNVKMNLKLNWVGGLGMNETGPGSCSFMGFHVNGVRIFKFHYHRLG